MVFLVRKMRTLPELRRFKVVVVTDRTDLEKQLGETARLTGETVQRATSTQDLQAKLGREPAGLVFGNQQVQDGTTRPRSRVRDRGVKAAGSGTDGSGPRDGDVRYSRSRCSTSRRRSCSWWTRPTARTPATLHANLLRALPNCGQIGFTGTPIIMGAQRQTHDIFGEFIDRYTIRQSEDGRRDGADPLRGPHGARRGRARRQPGPAVRGHVPRPQRGELEAIKQRYATIGNVLEAPA